MGKGRKQPKKIYNFLNANNTPGGNQYSPLDLTFIVNEPGRTLKERFEQLIKDCSFFDYVTVLAVEKMPLHPELTQRKYQKIFIF